MLGSSLCLVKIECPVNFSFCSELFARENKKSSLHANICIYKVSCSTGWPHAHQVAAWLSILDLSTSTLQALELLYKTLIICTLFNKSFMNQKYFTTIDIFLWLFESPDISVPLNLQWITQSKEASTGLYQKVLIRPGPVLEMSLWGNPRDHLNVPSSQIILTQAQRQ